MLHLRKMLSLALHSEVDRTTEWLAQYQMLQSESYSLSPLKMHAFSQLNICECNAFKNLFANSSFN